MLLRNSPKRSQIVAAGSDVGIWAPAVTLMTAGTFFVLSASAILASDKFAASGFFWIRQVVWWVAGLIALYSVSRLDYRRLYWLAPVLLAVGFALLIAVLWAEPVRQAKRWLHLGSFGFQPSEFFRLAYIGFLAFSLARRKEKLRREVTLIPYALILIAATVLLMLEPNFSAVLVLWGITVLVFLVAGVRKRVVFGGVLLAVAAAVLIVFQFGYKRDRVENYLSMVADPTNGCYQVSQAAIAMGSGGVLGRGLGSGWGKMHYVPDPHTDFIYASIAEEIGFMGAATILLLYFSMIWRGFSTSARAPDRFAMLLAAGITASLSVRVFMNIGVVLGLVPTTGLPLPLVSYGGSSLLFTTVAIGILLAVSRAALPERSRR